MDRYIKIILPTNGKDKWTISHGQGGNKKRTPSAIQTWLDRYCLASPKAGKTVVNVNYGLGYFNETCASKNPNYLLYTAYCFLEDYLPKESVAQKLKKYGKNHETP